MANPQPSDAHLRVAHKIQEQIMVSLFTEQQGRILDLILRLSWGCGKKEATIPLQSDFEVCGVGKTHVKAHLDWLIEAQVITKSGTSYAIQKDYDQWRVSRAIGYTKKRLNELIALNLDGKVTESVTPEKDSYVKRNRKVTESVTPLDTNSAPSKEIIKEERDISREIIALGGELIGVNDFWDRCLEALKSKVAGSNFNTWLANTSGVGFQEDAFILGVPSVFVSEEITKRFDPIITKTLSEAVGRRMEVICEVV